MGRAKKLDYEFNREEFKRLLISAMAGKSQKHFAEEAGISNSYISNYIRDHLEAPPSPKVLSKIARASRGKVDLTVLLRTAGYDPAKYLNDLQEEFLDDFYMDPSSTKILLGAITTALVTAPFQWQVVKNITQGFDLQISLVDQSQWFFKIITPELQMINMVRDFYGRVMTTPHEPTAKFSVITMNDSPSLYQPFFLNKFQSVHPYVSIILVNPLTLVVEREEFVNVALEDKHRAEKYKLTNFISKDTAYTCCDGCITK